MERSSSALSRSDTYDYISMIELNKIYNENCMDTMARMPDNFLDCLVTSPPYYGLRSYNTEPQIWGDKNCDHVWGESMAFAKQDNRTAEQKIAQGASVGSNVNFNDVTTTATSGNFCQLCGAWRGELGLEPTFQLYIQHLIDIFREVHRVLKPTGTVWVNLGDSYSGSNGNGYKQTVAGQNRSNGSNENESFRDKYKRDDGSIKPKSLMNIPHRFAIAMTDELGFIQRNDIIWHKPACMPSSAKDRFTVDFENIFFFTKSPKYWFEQQLEPIKQVSLDRVKSGWKSDRDSIGHIDVDVMGSRIANPDGRNMRTTWTVNFEPSGDEHYASYPTKLVEIPIKAGCPQYVCNKCGTPRQLIVKTQSTPTARETFGEHPRGNGQQTSTGWKPPVVTATELSDCGCGKGFSHGIVYDPFGGTATTALVAHKLGRNWICSELQPKYADIAEKRLEPYLAQTSLF